MFGAAMTVVERRTLVWSYYIFCFKDHTACVTDMLLLQLPDYPLCMSLGTEGSGHLVCDGVSLVSCSQRLERTYCLYSPELSCRSETEGCVFF